ncbi:Phenazine biosynthesis-like domain-containing protein [Arachis hypogaea]|nr:Phenazine biosynthesis-like domain-containing protein [Arachis hypogaea]
MLKPYYPCLILHHPSTSLLSPTTTIVCASNNRRQAFFKSQPSNLKILQLASIVAMNLKILPEPFNSLAAEIARGHITPPNLPEPSILTRIVAPPKQNGNKRRKKKLSLFALFALVCCAAGFWSFRVSDPNVFVRAFLFSIAGVSLIRMSLGKKAIKEWVLGFAVGVFFMASCGFGKEDFKFWVERLRVVVKSGEAVIKVEPKLDEIDPVCGTAHCAIASYWSKKLGKCDLNAYQASSRGGVFNIHVDEKQRVLLRGKAVIVMEGCILV